MKEKAIEVLGGKGPEATKALFDHIIRNTPTKHEEDHLRVLIDNNPKIPKPALAITGEGESSVSALIRTAQNLQLAGADFIVIPCNSAHYFINEIRSAVEIPIISIITETVAAAKEWGCKKLGLLATTGLIRSGLYQAELIEAGISSLKPEEQDQRNLMDQILRFKDTGESEGLRDIVRSISDKLILSGADGMILGCTEIPVVISQQDSRVPFFDTIEILALAAIREARA